MGGGDGWQWGGGGGGRGDLIAALERSAIREGHVGPRVKTSNHKPNYRHIFSMLRTPHLMEKWAGKT